jgi:hypothetical protein
VPCRCKHRDLGHNLYLVKDANFILADRLVRALNKLVKTLSKEDKSRLSN